MILLHGTFRAVVRNFSMGGFGSRFAELIIVCHSINNDGNNNKHKNDNNLHLW